MSPSEYQELTEFFIGVFERQRKETREAIEAARIEENGWRITSLSSRFDAVERGIDDHEERLRKVE